MNNIKNIITVINENGGAASLDEILDLYVNKWHILHIPENMQKIKTTLITHNGQEVFWNEKSNKWQLKKDDNKEKSDILTPMVSNAISVPDSLSAERYLAKKKTDMVEAYRDLFKAVCEKIPNAYQATVGSLLYISWKANNIKKSDFATIHIKTKVITIGCEIPLSEELRAVGEQIPRDGHHNHYFLIEYDISKQEQIVDAIVDSYKQLL